MPHLVFYIALIITFVSYTFHTFAHFFEYKGKQGRRSKVVDILLHIFIFAGYAAWVLMILTDPVQMNLSSYIAFPLGLIIGGAGLVLIIWSTIAKKGFSEIDHLVTKGIYAKLRHPMYLGTILIHLGFPLAAQSMLTLVSAIIWILQILLWKHIEERALIKKFGQKYLDYKKRTYF